METLLIIGALAAGAHYMTKDDDPVQTVYSSQTTEEISNFGTDDTRAKIMAQIDWSKVGIHHRWRIMDKRVLSEFYGHNDQTAQVKLNRVGEGDMFEVIWCGKSVGVYNTEQEAENVAENYALGSAVSRT